MSFSSRLQKFQYGVTLIELMVAIFLMLLITMATVALYTVNASSGRTVDASQGLDDTARFVFELLGQAVRDAGYTGAVPIETDGSLTPRTMTNLFDDCVGSADTVPCPVLGFDNAKVTPSDYGSAGTGGVNNSDSLALRFNGSSASKADRIDGRGDGGVLTCAGRTVPMVTKEEYLGLSVFWVGKGPAGEPEMYCSDGAITPTGSPSGGSGWTRPTSDAIARGVEVFQVMYALDISSSRDGVPDRWISASSMTAADWPHVKAVRIGLVLRGAPGSAQASSTEPLYPLGKDFSSGLTESGIEFTPPSDTRLRRVYTTTFMLRTTV